MSDDLVQNFVNGKLVDSAATEFAELVDPVTGQVTVGSPQVDARKRWTRPSQAAAAAFAEWRRTTPSAAGPAQAGRRDLERRDELVELQSRNTGQIKSLIASEEVTVGADQLRSRRCRPQPRGQGHR